MKKIIASTALAICSLWPTLTSAEEAPATKYPLQMVAEENTQLRRGATDSYAVVASIPSGKEVTVIDEFKNASGELWYRVQLNNLTGWSLADNFTVKKENFIGKNAIVAENNVVMRKGASQLYESIKTLRNGEIVKIIDEFTNSLNEKYFRIDVSGKKGWVLSGKLHIIDHVPAKLPANFSVVQTSSVRRGASTAYESVASIKKGEIVTVIDIFVTKDKKVWYRVDLGKVKGWVPESVLKNAVNISAPNKLTSPSASKEQAVTKSLYISVSLANVREKPTTQAKVVTQLKQGTSLKGIAVTTDEKGAKWYKVLLSNNQTAWVHETVVKEKSPSTTSNPTNSATETTKVVVTNNAVLYENPSFSASIVERMPKARKVTVIQKMTASHFNWIKVTSSSGKTGWVPEFELGSSTTQVKYVYAKGKASLRRGASEAYRIVKTLSANERLIYLYRYGDWLNVETASGVRGWVLEKETSTIATNSLVTPTIKKNGSDIYFTWQKTSNFKVSYTILSGNRLKLSGSFSYAEVPKFTIKGIQSIESFGSSVIVTFSPGYTFTIRNYSDEISIKIVQRGLKGKKIIVDAGHGGHDTGAIGPTGLREKDVTLDTALLLKAELEKAGAIVKLTRSTDVFLELAERTMISNGSDFDAFVSIHADSYSSTSKGSTTYFNTSVNFNGPKSKQMAQYVQKHLVAQLGTYNRGYREQEFYVNRKNELPSILVELAFVSNPKEEGLLKTKAFRQKAAVGIRKGLEEYFNNF
ncbi:MAG TPA: SH3 domain-containing protein [Anoxybacillus sp.]|nr:SH3 domain-containing protein [Anoxybacillus sp.]